MEKNINQKYVPTNHKRTKSSLLDSKINHGGMKKSTNVQENRLLNMDNTLLQNINLDEIEQNADDLVCRSSKRPEIPSLHRKVNKWPNLSLKNHSDTNSRSGNPQKKNTSNQKPCTNATQKAAPQCNKSDKDIMSDKLRRFEEDFRNEFFTKQCNGPGTNKTNGNDLRNSPNSCENMLVGDTKTKNLDCSKAMHENANKKENQTTESYFSQVIGKKEKPVKSLPNSTCSRMSSDSKNVKIISCITLKNSSSTNKLPQSSIKQKQVSNKNCSHVTSINAFNINASDFLDNDIFKGFPENNVESNDEVNKVVAYSHSNSLFSSLDSADLGSKLSYIKHTDMQMKSDSKNCTPQTSANKNTNSENKLSASQNDFSQFFNCTQVVKQLDNAVSCETQTIEGELSNIFSSNIFSHSDNSELNVPGGVEGAEKDFKTPNKCSDKVNSKRKSLEIAEGPLKIPKVNSTNFSKAESKENEYVEGLTSNENLKDNKIEYRMTQLLKSSQYRNEVSHLFENLEHSICQLGPNQDPLHQSISHQVVENADWPDDSFMTEAFLNGLTQHTESNSIGDQLKRALKENAVKPAEPQNLVNRTVINTEIIFQELGSFYGLPIKVKELIKLYKGIDKLYDWQDECLNLPAVKQRNNLIYSLPTSGGKTLVAEILILREIICRKRNAIFVLPYVAIVQEKVWALSPFAVALDFLIEEYAAGKGSYPPRKRRHKNSVYIATTEKALGIVNSLVEHGRLDELGLIVVDELHLIGDEHRGHTLEALLTKLMYINDNTQIVGMSATIGNLPDLQQFLKAEVYSRNFRPVELIEYVKCENQIAKINWNADEDHVFEPVRTADFHYSEDLIKIDPDRLGGLVMETIPQGSCLIFCPSKKSCENVTKLLCKIVFRTLKEHKSQDKLQLLSALKNEAGTLCPILQESVHYGIAYHHSGLTAEERRLIEESYRSGILCVICCTSTLAAGVNLPAKRVIIRKPYIAQNFISLSRYKQMIGRAGRAGLGEMGESILICTREELKKVKELLLSPMDQILSKMCNSERLRLLFLSCISLGTANTVNQLQQVTNMTLLAVQQEKLDVDIKKLIKTVIYDLFKFNAVQTFEDSNKNTTNSGSMSDVSVCFNSSNLSSPGNSSNLQKTCDKKSKKHVEVTNTTKLVISKSGSAAIKGGLELYQAMLLYEDLQEAQESLVLVDCLHLLYLVTPYNLVEQIKPDKNHYYNIMMHLGKQERKTATIIGIKEGFVMRMLSNQAIKTIPERVLNRFYASLMLYDLWNEVSVFDVSEKYQVNRGIVQNLMTQAATFAANVVNFCQQFEEFWAFTHLLRGMSQRLAHCCCRELLPLMELPAVKQSRARQLFNAGYKSLQSIAKADPNELVQAIEFMSRKVANQLIAAAKMLLLEKVETLREEAEDILDGVENPKLIFDQTFHIK